MSNPHPRRLKLTEMREQALDAVGMTPGLDLELDNGEIITVPNPLLLDDDVQAALKDAGDDAVGTAKVLLGAEQHARLLAGGGRSTDVQLALVIMKEDLAANPKLRLPSAS